MPARRFVLGTVLFAACSGGTGTPRPLPPTPAPASAELFSVRLDRALVAHEGLDGLVAEADRAPSHVDAHATAIVCMKRIEDHTVSHLPKPCFAAIEDSHYPPNPQREHWMKLASATEAAIRLDPAALRDAMTGLRFVEEQIAAAPEWTDVYAPDVRALVAHQRELDRALVAAILPRFATAGCDHDVADDLLDTVARSPELADVRDRVREAAAARKKRCGDLGAAAEAEKDAAEREKDREAAAKLAEYTAAAKDPDRGKRLAAFDQALARGDFTAVNDQLDRAKEGQRPEMRDRVRKVLHDPFVRIAALQTQDAPGHPALAGLVRKWFDQYGFADIELPPTTPEVRTWSWSHASEGLGEIDSCPQLSRGKEGRGVWVKGIKCFDKIKHVDGSTSTTTSSSDVQYNQGADQGFGTRDATVTRTTTTTTAGYDTRTPWFEIPATIDIELPDGVLQVRVTAKSGAYDGATIIAAIEKPVGEAVHAHAAELAKRAQTSKDPLEVADLYARVIMLTDDRQLWGTGPRLLRERYKLPEGLPIRPR